MSSSVAAAVHPPRVRVGPIQALQALRRDPLAFLLRAHEECGPIGQGRIGPITIFWLHEPHLVEQVLVSRAVDFRKGRVLAEAQRIVGEGLLTSEGDHHRRQRRLIQPLFAKDRIQGYGRDMAALADAQQRSWVDGRTVDVYDQMVTLTLRIVVRTLFGSELDDARIHQVQDAFARVLDAFDLAIGPFGRLAEKLSLPKVRRFRAARAELDEILFEIIRASRQATGEEDGLIARLVAAREEQSGQRMSERQVRDEAMTLFLAGHETTANALTWTWYALSQAPAARERLEAELDEVLGDRAPTPEDLPRLPYTRAVFAESMRLYPPAYAIGRMALWRVDLGEVVIPEKTIVVTSPYVVHRDPRWWPEAERFLPERWLEDDPERPRFAYFPFGGGPRLCIGEAFAWMEGVLVLAAQARAWRMHHEPGHRVEPQARITLRPRYGMRMVLERRAGVGADACASRPPR